MNYKEYYDLSYNATNYNRSYERKMSNNVKSFLISNYLQRYVGDNTYVIDMCGGKCQDLYKWIKLFNNNDFYNDIIRYVNLDISEKGIEEANKRINNITEVFCGQKKQYRAYVYNVFNDYLSVNLPISLVNRPCIMSCQLAIHYSFENIDKFRCCIKNILIFNPIVIFLTYPDPHIIKNIEDNEKSMTNNDGDIIAKVNNVKYNKDKIFGNSYDYYQMGTCVESKIHEYIVNEEILFDKFKNLGYKIILDKNHKEIVNVTDSNPVAFYKSVIFTLY